MKKKCLRMILKLVQRIWVESLTPVSHLPFVYVSASQPEGGELGICGIVITVLCYILVVVTFPFSLFFCLKVSLRKTLDCIETFLYRSMQWVSILRDFDCRWDKIEVRVESWDGTKPGKVATSLFLLLLFP